MCLPRPGPECSRSYHHIDIISNDLPRPSPPPPLSLPARPLRHSGKEDYISSSFSFSMKQRQKKNKVIRKNSIVIFASYLLFGKFISEIMATRDYLSRAKPRRRMASPPAGPPQSRSSHAPPPPRRDTLSLSSSAASAASGNLHHSAKRKKKKK